MTKSDDQVVAGLGFFGYSPLNDENLKEKFLQEILDPHKNRGYGLPKLNLLQQGL